MFEKPGRHVYAVFLHCSASDNPEHDDVEVIRRWHTDRPPEGRGWSDIGYHFFIKKDGTVQKGRGLHRTPAAQKGYNTGSIAICLHGLTEFTVQQFNSLRMLCNEINKSYDHITFHGHCEVNSNKTCPVFDYKTVLNLDNEGIMHERAVPTEPPVDLGIWANLYHRGRSIFK